MYMQKKECLVYFMYTVLSLKICVLIFISITLRIGQHQYHYFDVEVFFFVFFLKKFTLKENQKQQSSSAQWQLKWPDFSSNSVDQLKTQICKGYKKPNECL